MEPEHGYADAGGVRIHYLDWGGSGTPVLCIPGITANARAFDGLAEALAPRRVVPIDLRGRGESDKPETGYDVATHAADAVAVMRSLGVERAAVIGWSLGAKVALALAALHPGAVERVVAIDPPVDTSTEARSVLGRFWARLDRTYPSLDAFLAQMRAAWTFTEWTPYVERYLRADVVEGADGVVRHRIPRWVPEAELAAEGRYPTRSFYGRVRCPALVLRAPLPMAVEGDQVLGAADAEEMARSLADARLVEVEGTNHFTIVLDRPERTIEPVGRFLG